MCDRCQHVGSIFCSAWQHGSSGAAVRRHWGMAVSLGHGRGICHHRRAATACHCGGDEDTCSNSNGRDTNNQQSTKSSKDNGSKYYSNGNDDRVVVIAWQLRQLGGFQISSTAAVRRHGGMATAAATTAMLSPRAGVVVMKTPVATAMAGAQTINNQLKAAMATVTETATTTAMT
jgi:hypothetical protein